MSSQSNNIADRVQNLANEMDAVAKEAAAMSSDPVVEFVNNAGTATHDGSFFMMGLTVFMLACFVGYYVVWRVTPALHSPLMGVTNAISSVIIVGAIIAAGPLDGSMAKILGFLGVILASINIFGGFIVTQRMLSMFKKKS